MAGSSEHKRQRRGGETHSQVTAENESVFIILGEEATIYITLTPSLADQEEETVSAFRPFPCRAGPEYGGTWCSVI